MIDLLQVADKLQCHHVHTMFLFPEKPLSFNSYFHNIFFLGYVDNNC